MLMPLMRRSRNYTAGRQLVILVYVDIYAVIICFDPRLLLLFSKRDLWLPHVGDGGRRSLSVVELLSLDIGLRLNRCRWYIIRGGVLHTDFKLL